MAIPQDIPNYGVRQANTQRKDADGKDAFEPSMPMISAKTAKQKDEKREREGSGMKEN